MAIFHYTIKIVGRSKGKSVISASAYLNGDVMKNEETGRISYYTSKKEVVYTRLMMCENAPPEWQIVPEENIKRFQKSVRYKRSEDKEAALEKFKITFQKQRLWNEVLKIEKTQLLQFSPAEIAGVFRVSVQNDDVHFIPPVCDRPFSSRSRKRMPAAGHILKRIFLHRISWLLLCCLSDTRAGID